MMMTVFRWMEVVEYEYPIRLELEKREHYKFVEVLSTLQRAINTKKKEKKEN
jgi:hypothetical protein